MTAINAYQDDNKDYNGTGGLTRSSLKRKESRAQHWSSQGSRELLLVGSGEAIKAVLQVSPRNTAEIIEQEHQRKAFTQKRQLSIGKKDPLIEGLAIET